MTGHVLQHLLLLSCTLHVIFSAGKFLPGPNSTLPMVKALLAVTC